MPNGHGGIPPYLAAVGLLIALVLVYVYSRKEGLGWVGYAGYPLAAGLGWRFAYGLHMWKVTEYDGAYSSDEAMNLAIGKYLIGSVVYALVAMAAWYFVI